jgi:hypothetical protein
MVIFSDMKGGDHLSDDEAQLTEAELTLYKYQHVYNFPPEQSALTTLCGRVLDYNVGDERQVDLVSYEFAKKYSMSFEEYGEVGYPENLVRKVKSSVHMHTHPIEKIAKYNFKFDYDWYGVMPGPNDLSCLLYYSPIQNLIIGEKKILVMQSPVENRILCSDERYTNREIIKEIKNHFYNGSGKNLCKGFDLFRYFLDDYFKLNYGCETYPRSKSEAFSISKESGKRFCNTFDNAALIEFCLECAIFRIPSRFIQNIDIVDGVGKVCGFPEDTFRMVKEMYQDRIILDRFSRRNVLDCDGNLDLPEWN